MREFGYTAGHKINKQKSIAFEYRNNATVKEKTAHNNYKKS